MSLYDGHEGLGRYADQQVLYQWNRFEQLASLPHAAFLGQCDPRANGDEWIIVRAATTGPPQQGKFVSSQGLVSRGATVQTGRGYKSGDGVINLSIAAGAAILADFFAEGVINQNGLVNRIMGHGSVPAAGGDMELILEYPFQDDIAAGQTFELKLSKWGGVRNSGDNDLVCVGWSPITPTGGYYHWIKKCGDIEVFAPAAIAVGAAIAVDANGNAETAVAGAPQVAVANEAIGANAWGSATLTLGL